MSDNFAYEVLALDKGSMRSVDENGFLHVKISPLTRVQVAPYYGKEIPGWQSLGLQPDKIYKGYRPESELKKLSTVNSINGIPIQLRHHADFADNPAKDTRIGATGTDGEFKYPFLMNSLHFFDKKAKELIESEALRELSLAYRYRPDFSKSGVTEDGQPYDFVMRDISGNHLALVEQGRAGHEVLVYDSKRSDMHENEELVAQLVNDALDKKLSGIVNTLNKVVDRFNKYVEKNTEAEKVEETEEAEEIVTDKCGSKKTAKDKKADKPLVDEEGEEVEEIIDLSDESKDLPETKQKDKKKSEKVKAETEEVISDEETEEESEDFEESEEVEKDPEDNDEKVVEKKVEKKAVKTEKPEKSEEESFEDKLVRLMKESNIAEDAPQDVKDAFVVGYKQGRKNYGKKMAEDAAPHFTESDVAKAYEDARNDLLAEMKAIDDVKPVLGNVKLGAYDSAENIYEDACKKLELTCDASNARDVYNAYLRTKQNLQKAGATVHSAKTDNDVNVLNDIFSKVDIN